MAAILLIRRNKGVDLVGVLDQQIIPVDANGNHG